MRPESITHWERCRRRHYQRPQQEIWKR